MIQFIVCHLCHHYALDAFVSADRIESVQLILPFWQQKVIVCHVPCMGRVEDSLHLFDDIRICSIEFVSLLLLFLHFRNSINLLDNFVHTHLVFFQHIPFFLVCRNLIDVVKHVERVCSLDIARCIVKIVAPKSSHTPIESIWLWQLQPEILVSILFRILREVVIFRTETCLSEITCLLPCGA